MKDTSKAQKQIFFWIGLILLFVLLFRQSYGGEVNKINATMLAFNYEYGFVSRGFIGTLYHILDSVLPWDLMSYTWTVRFTQAITFVYYIILFVFLGIVLKKSTDQIRGTVKCMIIFFVIFAVPMFTNTFNFGRLDIYCVMISIVCASLLIYEKAVWLVVPFSAISVMVHQGNVFMYLNIILVLLIYKAFSKEGKEKKKYFILFVISFLSASVLFLYFEFFSHFNGTDIYDRVVSEARALCMNGEYHQDVIDHEILGIDLSDREILWRKKNIVEFPIFLLLIAPYILFSIKFFKELLKDVKGKKDKYKYIFVIIGAGTIVPDLLLKCDYGRWMFAIICYYSVVMLSLLAMGDNHIEKHLINSKEMLLKKYPASIFLLGYPLVLVPFGDVAICGLSYGLAEWVNSIVLHWW